MSDWTSNPDVDRAKDDLVDLAGTVENLDTILGLAQVAIGGSKGVKQLADEIASFFSQEAVTLDAEKLAQALQNVLQKGHGDYGGWHLYTHIEVEECRSCFLGLGSKWRSLTPSPWKQHLKDGIDGNGMFDSRFDAYRKAKEACQQHMAEFTAGPK